LLRVARLRREWLVRYIAQAIAQDISRSPRNARDAKARIQSSS
jgi:hypothetical protein